MEPTKSFTDLKVLEKNEEETKRDNSAMKKIKEKKGH